MDGEPGAYDPLISKKKYNRLGWKLWPVTNDPAYFTEVCNVGYGTLKLDYGQILCRILHAWPENRLSKIGPSKPAWWVTKQASLLKKFFFQASLTFVTKASVCSVCKVFVKT